MLLLLLLALIGVGLFQISKSRTFQFFGGLTHHVVTNDKVIALTLDDGPSSQTREVLDNLRQKNVKATFFAIGQDMTRHPDITQAIVAEGHQLANHSYSHNRFLLKNQEFIASEVEKTSNLIRQASYSGEIVFRPPNGKKLFGLPWYLNQHGIKTIMWDIEPDTYLDVTQSETQKTEFIVSHTLQRVRPGSIILLHPFCEGCGADRAAIPKIIDELHAQGYTFVTINELLAKKTP
jgi:peptidoglycan-N-acetylglucosamine deacetylase